jgi:prophage regulatory protein
MATKVLRLPELKRLTGLSRSSIYNYVSTGAFPRPLRLGPRAVGWLESEIEDWLSQRLKARAPMMTKEGSNVDR